MNATLRHIEAKFMIFAKIYLIFLLKLKFEFISENLDFLIPYTPQNLIQASFFCINLTR